MTNLRLLWISHSNSKINLSVGLNTIVSANIKQAKSKLRGRTVYIYVPIYTCLSLYYLYLYNSNKATILIVYIDVLYMYGVWIIANCFVTTSCMQATRKHYAFWLSSTLASSSCLHLWWRILRDYSPLCDRAQVGMWCALNTTTTPPLRVLWIL